MAEPLKPAGRDWPDRHLWQIQPIRDGLVIAAAIGLIWLGHKLSIVTVPILLALLLAYLFEPVVAAATRRGVFTRRGAAITIILLGVAALLGPVGIGGGFAAWQGVRLATRTVRNIDLMLASVAQPEDEQLRQALPDSWERIRNRIVADEPLRRELAKLAGQREGEPDEQPPPQPAAPTAADETTDTARLIQWTVSTVRQNAAAISQRVLAAGGGLLGGAFDVLGSVGKFLFGTVLTAFFFYYFSTGHGKVLEFWQGLIPERRKGRYIDLAKQMDVVIAGFVRGRITVAAVLVVVYTLVYWMIGVPAPLIVGPIMGVLTIVPYASTIAAPVAMILMWLDPAGGWRGEWWWIIGGPLVALAVTQFLDDWVLTPAIQGKATNMDVPTILFASIAGGALAGFYGVLVAIPVAACVKILLREFFWPRFRAWSQGRAPDMLPIKET
jgi:predicted PurR-regulated permease PerM